MKSNDSQVLHYKNVFFRCVFISDPGNFYGLKERLGGELLRRMHLKPVQR